VPPLRFAASSRRDLLNARKDWVRAPGLRAAWLTAHGPTSRRIAVVCELEALGAAVMAAAVALGAA